VGDPAAQYNSPNVYSGQQFYNWGTFSTCQASAGGFAGPLSTCGPGFVQSYDGHDAFAAMFGDLIHPNENLLGGMIVPGEWSNARNIGNSMTNPYVPDNTELWWGSHAECNFSLVRECKVAEWDGFNGFIYLGAHQRLADSQYITKANLKATGTLSLTLRINASDSGSGTCTSPGSVTNPFFPVTTSWAPYLTPVDFTGKAGCVMEVVWQNPTKGATLEVGYFNFIPKTNNCSCRLELIQ
jgi:hypothetical protein